tara:strand:+ start:30937 stop:35637 length:4701 start_codon:yes stop_codon:yes gene_type:complete
MIKGNIEIIQSSGGKDTTLFRGSNMVTDGVRKTIADVMTYMPNPFGGSAMEIGTSSVSSYQIQAMSLGSAAYYYNARNSRFWFSSMELSGERYQYLPPTTNNHFEMLDCYSSIGNNQWMSKQSQEANLIQGGTLEDFSLWNFRQDSEPNPEKDPITRTLTPFAEGEKEVTRFEVRQGQVHTIISQPVDMSLGEVYHVLTHGKAYEATLDVRIGRGRLGQIYEYYDFTQNRFVLFVDAEKTTRKVVKLGDNYSVNSFRFKLEGHARTGDFNSNGQYFIEYSFPALEFKDWTFAPWETDYVNPFIDIIKLELLNDASYILENPNFLKHQSRLLNSDFNHTYELVPPYSDVKNQYKARERGLVGLVGWSQVNPLARYSDNPTFTESASGLGFVQPLTEGLQQNTSFSSVYNGILLHASSSELASSGAAAITQQFLPTYTDRNLFAFANPRDTSPLNLAAGARGQGDNNATYMLYFNAMVSGAASPAGCGNIEVTLTDSQGGTYAFYPDSNLGKSDIFQSGGTSKKFTFDRKNTWLQFSVPVTLPPSPEGTGYTLGLKGSGRTDGTNGFCSYAIKDFSFGPLGEWRVYSYNGPDTVTTTQTRYSTWELSSGTGTKVTPGAIFSALSFSSQRYIPGSPEAEEIRDSIYSATSNGNMNQLTQNIVGLEPTKSYRLSLKGGTKDLTDPSFVVSFKAKMRGEKEERIHSSYNVLGSYFTVVESPVGVPADINSSRLGDYSPYSDSTEGNTTFGSNLPVIRMAIPSFAYPMTSPNAKPTDWGVQVEEVATISNSSNINLACMVGEQNIPINKGKYTLSMDVISEQLNSSGEGAHFVLSALTAPNQNNRTSKMYFNWSSNTFDTMYDQGEMGGYGYNQEFSATYMLPLPSSQGSYTSFKHNRLIAFDDSMGLAINDGRTLNVSTGPVIGRYRFGSAIIGANPARPGSDGGQVMVKNVSLRGPSLNPGLAPSIEKYYNFEDQTWQTSYAYTKLKVNSSQGESTRSFIATTPQMISNMALNGLDRDTQYQLNIMDSSGGEYTLYDVALNDSALVANTGNDLWQRDASIFTSEPYADNHITDYSEGTVIKSLNNGILANVATPTAWGSTYKQWEANAFTPAGTHPNSVVPNTAEVPTLGVSGFNSTTHRPQVLTNFILQDYNISATQKMAVGWDVNCTQIKTSTLATAEMRLYAMYNGVTYGYQFGNQSWAPSRNSAAINTQGAVWLSGIQLAASSNSVAPWGYGGVSASNDVINYTHFLSPTFNAPTFGPTTKIIAALEFPNTLVDSETINIKSFKTYTWATQNRNDWRVSGETFAFPQFPQPSDHTLQPATRANTPGELGQFLNRINYFDYSSIIYADGVSSTLEINNPMSPSPTGELSLEQAITMGAYLPSAGLFFGSGTFGTRNQDVGAGQGLQFSGMGLVSGTLNQMGVVNSDGYIYKHPHTPTNVHDASAGFIASSFTLPASTLYAHKTIRYVLKLTKDDWHFLDYYMGGIGSMGLHTIDYKKTYEKLGTAYQISGTDNSYSQGYRGGLYNVDNPDKNPVFNLSNKKVMFPPGLQIDWNNTDYITIIWDTTFV